MEKIFISTYDELKKKSFIIKFIEHWKDELIIFISPINNELRVFSSICSHFGGEIFYDKKENILRCKWHDWKYCTKTGKCLSYPIKGVLKPFFTQIFAIDFFLLPVAYILSVKSNFILGFFVITLVVAATVSILISN